MLPTPPASQVSTDALHDRMNDPPEDQNVIITEAQQGNKRQKSNMKDNSTRNQHRTNSFVQRQSEPINQSDQDMNVFTTIDVTHDNGQSTNDKSTHQHEQDTDTYTTTAREYANEGIAYDTDDDNTQAMEEGHYQDQGAEDQYSSRVYSNGENANKHSRKQRDNLRRKTKSCARAQAKKAAKNVKRSQMHHQTHYPMHPEEEETL